MRLILSRHTERLNKEDEGDDDISKNGVDLAEQKILQLTNTIELSNVVIYASPLTRTMKTANIYKNHLKTDTLVVDYRLIEDMRKAKIFSKEQICAMDENGISFGESIDDIKRRVESFLLAVSKQDSDVLVVTHGIVYNLILQYYFPYYTFDVDATNPTFYFPPYCSITVLSVEDNKAKHDKSKLDIF